MTANNGVSEANVRRSMVNGSIISSQMEVAQQERAIRQITAENEKLKKEIAATTGVPYDYVKADRYATLKAEVDALERKYQFEKMKKNELMKKYQIARIDLLESRRLKGGVNAERENAAAVQRQVEILENRLDQALTKFNDAISYNKELRDQIDIIRDERRVFQRVFKRMEENVRAKKKLMSERIERSNKDLDERDSYARQLEQLQKAINDQRQEYDEKVRELDYTMVEIKDMQEEQQRRQIDFEARSYEFEEEADNTGFVCDSFTRIESYGKSSKRHGQFDESGEMTQDDSCERNERECVAEMELNLKDIVQQLEEFSQDGDLHKVANYYESLGDSSFSLYKRINELTTDREEMEREIQLLKTAITEELENEERQRQLIKGLEEQLAETEGLLEETQASVTQRRQLLGEIREVTEEIFHQIGCSTDGSKAALGGTDHCTESNHMQFLGLIEEQVTRIIYAAKLRRHQEDIQAGSVTLEVDPNSSLKDECSLKGDGAAKSNGNITDNAAEAEENTLTLTVESLKEDADDTGILPAAAGEENGVPLIMSVADKVPPLFSMPNMTSGPGVSAAWLVRQSCLPSAHLGGDEGVEVLEEGEGDPLVSHAEVRKQMEQRLLAKREREERAQRRKRELKEQLLGQASSRKK